MCEYVYKISTKNGDEISVTANYKLVSNGFVDFYRREDVYSEVLVKEKVFLLFSCTRKLFEKRSQNILVYSVHIEQVLSVEIVKEVS